MGRRYHPSLLPLRGRPLRLPRRLSEADRTTLLQVIHQIRDLQREADRLRSLNSEMISTWLLINTNGAMIRDLQQLYRDLALEIQGVRNREVPGMNREKKDLRNRLVNDLAEEMHDIRAELVELRALLAREAGR